MNWAGREVSIQVLLKDVKGRKLPEADDDFAKTASEFDTLTSSATTSASVSTR